MTYTPTLNEILRDNADDAENLILAAMEVELLIHEDSILARAIELAR